MATSATVRIMPPEEIAARGGGETPHLLWPQRDTVFAEREMRLRQLAAGHAMRDYLLFMADLAHAQQAALRDMPDVPLPGVKALDEAARRAQPPLPAADWPRDPAWYRALQGIVSLLCARAPEGAKPVLERLADARPEWLEQQADCLLTGVTRGLDMASAPIVAAALQVYWLHMVDRVRHGEPGREAPFGRIVDETVCPCCGSRPTASITRTAGELLGQRYLHCSLCASQWYMVRIKCSNCLGTTKIGYQSLDHADGDDDGGSSRAAKAAVQAETCDDCHHYLKIIHAERDPFVEPAADDLATLTLDLLVSEAGMLRHGVNFMLLFGDPEDDGDPGHADHSGQEEDSGHEEDSASAPPARPPDDRAP